MCHGYTYVADNVADKNISNIALTVADIFLMLLIHCDSCGYFFNVADKKPIKLVK